MIGDIEQSASGIARALQLLRQGKLTEAHGLVPWGSNFTFLMNIADGGLQALAVYKPRRGERPLWDFPEGTLCQREVAAFVVSEALGWHLVPPTILRDGPHGIGMVQLYIDHDPEQHYFTFGPQQRSQLERIALFDAIINNADRKGGHCLLDRQGVVWAIDHGVAFHVQPKLRSVIWDFAGVRIPKRLLEDIKKFADQLAGADLSCVLLTLLENGEVKAVCDRAETLLRTGEYPQAGPGRSYPWPPI